MEEPEPAPDWAVWSVAEPTESKQIQERYKALDK